MVARRVSFLTVALLALAVSNSVTSGANPKCWPKAQTTPSTDVSTPAPQELEAPSPNTGGSQEYDFGQADGSAETPSTDFTQSSQADTPSTDFTQFSQAGPPSTESSQAGPPSTDFSQAGPPSTDFSQAGPPSTESSQAGPPSTESSQAGPPSTDFSQAGSPPTGSAAGPSPAQSSQEDPTTESSQSSPTQGSSAGGNGTTSGGGGAISFGDITSGSDKCVIGNPNTYLTGKDADWIWENVMKEYIPTFNNLIFDQLVTSKGSLSYCPRFLNNDEYNRKYR
ncbi:hypothetical protein PHYBOEH_009346 [Phytophthora boehmeriae]|uniref:Uncharacterized protein n=1 Tax=Phytophthora boehmeriae TaxID=109152 RepID=A0A8T1VTA5_9STRA|nr:hypothetical protein PHYBOEH_009346 [Phytophthora boehmeriae]